jgi:hypothetical protein
VLQIGDDTRVVKPRQPWEHNTSNLGLRKFHHSVRGTYIEADPYILEARHACDALYQILREETVIAWDAFKAERYQVCGIGR